VNLFKALLGHPSVSDYDKIPSTIDHKLATTWTELDRVTHARAWLSCFFNREATIDKATKNFSDALIDLKHSLARTANSGETTKVLVNERIGYIIQAITYAESTDLTETQRSYIVKGLKSLQDYSKYLTIYQRSAYNRAIGIVDAEPEAPKSELEIIKEAAGNQGLLLEKIAKDIEAGSPNSAILRDSAREIKHRLNGDLLPKLKKLIIDLGEYQGFIEYLKEIDERIFPPTAFERLESWLSSPPQSPAAAQEGNE